MIVAFRANGRVEAAVRAIQCAALNATLFVCASIESVLCLASVALLVVVVA